jgi:transglutaminase-like putative cysteine protease
MRSIILQPARATALAMCFIATICGCVSGHGQEQAPDPVIAHVQLTNDLLVKYQTAMAEGQPATAREAAERLFAKERAPWAQFMLAAAWGAEGNRDEAFRVLSSAIESFGRDPVGAGPLTIDYATGLASADHSSWTSLRSDPRFPALIARAKAVAWQPEPLEFDKAPAKEAVRMKRPAVESESLRMLREAYQLDTVVAGATDDLDRVRRMCRWVNGRTSHQGWSGELPKDARGLLQVAEKGAQWRCVEYGLVVAECLNAVGIPARTVGAWIRNVETELFGAGHVFAEAWLDDRQRWVFVDAQLNIVGVEPGGAPLNAVEFRRSLARPSPPIPYPAALALCLYYFRFTFEGADGKVISTVLGPVGSKAPTKFQRVHPIPASDLFTHRLADIYAPPAYAESSAEASPNR